MKIAGFRMINDHKLRVKKNWSIYIPLWMGKAAYR